MKNGISALILVGLGFAAFISFFKDWKNIQPTAAARSQFLKKEIAAFEIGEYLKLHPEYRVVQIGLESDMYYLPSNTIGDWFGPGRYRSFFGLGPAALSERLKQFNANGIIFSAKHSFSKALVNADDFKDYFVLVKRTSGADLYAVK